MAKSNLLLLLLFFSFSAQAHHSRAMIDSNNSIVLDGVVSKKTWRNPHVYYEIDVTNAEGATETWVLETHSVSSLIGAGWTQDLLNVGDKVQAKINTHRDSRKKYGSLSEVTLADGSNHPTFRRQVAGGPSTPVQPSTDFSGTWTLANALNRGGAIGNEAVSGPSHWPLTAKGREQVENFDVAEDPVYQCIFYGLPRLATSVYSRSWERSADRIVIQQEQYDVTRTIWLDGRSMPANYEPNRYGFSTGRFEADGTLVVTTVGFSDTPWGNEAGLDSSAQKQLIERYKLAEDGMTMDFSYTIIDPVYLSEPVTETLKYRKIAAREYVYEECDVENASRPLDYLSDSQ